MLKTQDTLSSASHSQNILRSKMGVLGQLEAYYNNPPESRILEEDCNVPSLPIYTAQKLAVEKHVRTAEIKYSNAFEGKAKTINELNVILGYTYSGVAKQLATFMKKGLVKKEGVVMGTKKDIWVNVGLVGAN